MYIQTLQLPALGQPKAKPHRAPFKTGGEYISEKDGEKLLSVLAGPSPFQGYIQPLMARRSSALPKRVLRIVASPAKVPNPDLRSRFTSSGGRAVGGTIDRAKGEIWMVEVPKVPDHTRLEFALHEAVHLFAHPFTAIVDDASFEQNYGRSCGGGATDTGTFQRKFCKGFGEGATQVITEMIMKAQGIGRYYRERPYDQFTPVVRKLIDILSLDRLARAYFQGNINDFTRAVLARWGPAWQNVANFTSAGEHKLALKEIEKLELAHHKRLQRRSPPGDYPVLPASTRMA
jgi:hypothetical protein